MVNAVGDQMANTWGPGGGGAGAGPDAPAATTGPSCWIESPLQRHLLDLRLRAGLLKVVKVHKRKRDASSDRAGGDGNRVSDNDDNINNSGQAESPPQPPTPMSSLTTDHLSVVSATLSSASQASQASAHAGLNKPDLVILGQTPPIATTTDPSLSPSSNPTQTRVLTPTFVSLTCERKDNPNNAAEGFAQAIAYALTAASVYGTPFGLYWYQNRFVRIVVASEDLLVIESSASVRLDIRTAAAASAASAASSFNQDHQGQQGRATSVQLSDLLAVLTNRRAINMCLHSLWDSDTGENDDQSIQTLWDLFMHCLALVLQHPTSCPRLARPAGWDPILAGLRFDQQAVEVRGSSHERERERGWDDLAFAAYRGQQARLRNAAAQRRAETVDNGESNGSDSDRDNGHPPDDGDDDADKDHDNDNDNDHDGGDEDEDGGRGSGTDGGGSIHEDEDGGDRDSRQDADGSPSPSPSPGPGSGSGPGLDRATIDKVLEIKWGGKEVYLDSLIAPIDPARPTAIDLLRLAHPSARVMLVDPDVIDALVATSDRELQERLQARLAQVDGRGVDRAGTGTGRADDHDDNDDDHDHDHDGSNYARHTERALDPKRKTPGTISLPHGQLFST